MKETKKTIAICGSFVCTGMYIHDIKNKDFIKKDVPRGTFECPDCRHALRWVNEKNRRHITVSREHKKKFGHLKTFDLNGV